MHDDDQSKLHEWGLKCLFIESAEHVSMASFVETVLQTVSFVNAIQTRSGK